MDVAPASCRQFEKQCRLEGGATPLDAYQIIVYHIDIPSLDGAIGIIIIEKAGTDR